MALIRGANPIWTLFDLTGQIFDDTYYMFVLSNTIPYVPLNFYRDPDGNAVWPNPIQFNANGTLPNNIYFDDNTVYRLEFRQGNTSSDPLMYLVENYDPGEGGSTPITSVALASDNQITNPQFSLISFESPYEETTFTPASPIEVAPGWFLNLAGTGNVTLRRVALDNSSENPSNAPYAIRITLGGGWSGTPYLSQRFQQNGMLWASKYVANSITAKVEGSNVDVSAILVDSNGTQVAEVLDTKTVDTTYREFTGYDQVADTTNPDDPPNAWVEYRLLLSTTCDIFVSSLQLIVSELAGTYSFEQDTIDRQLDHTFHYYKNSILLQPKQNILTAWDFSLNPWQFRTPADSNLANNAYTADQTIVIQQAFVTSATPDNVQVGRAGVAQNYGFKVTAVTDTNQFALVQYIAPQTIRPYWSGTLSLMMKVDAQKQASNDLRVKARLIYRSSLPSAVAQNEPVLTWSSGGEPTFAVGWTAIEPKNDPVYNLGSGESTIVFEGFDLPAADNADMTLGVVVYTLDPMIESGTPDNMVFGQCSLVANEFAMDAQTLTFDETLRRCQYYYEKSYDLSAIPGVDTSSAGALIRHQRGTTVGSAMRARSFDVVFAQTKRASNYTFTTYNPGSTAPGNVLGVIYSGGTLVSSVGAAFPSTHFAVYGASVHGISYATADNNSFSSGVAGDQHYIAFQFTCDSRLGV